MTGQLIDVDNDNSYMKVAGQDQCQITIITTYCPYKQYGPGDSAINAQQCRVLRQQGINNPNPHNKWGKELVPLLKQWKHEGT
eukprot:6068476-Ditylum_brightwellii.AAC.1